MYTRLQMKEYMRNWRQKNRELIRVNLSEWKRRERETRTPEKQEEMNAYARRYYAEHKIRLKENIRRNHNSLSESERMARKQSITIRKRLHRQAHPLILKIQNAKRRNRIKRVSDGSVTTEFLRHLLRVTTVCPYCRTNIDANDQHFDHKSPIALGGQHTRSNIILCCGACNRNKGALPYDVWMKRLSGVNKQ